jgi:YD repeat-containing protein
MSRDRWRTPVSQRAYVSLGFVLGLLAPRPLQAALPEVTHLSVASSGTLSWDALTGASGYNVYEGNLAGLRTGNYGGCLLGSVQATTASPAATTIPTGSGIFFLVDGFDPSGEGQVSDVPGANPAPRCIPARRIFPLASNGDPGDGVADGREPLRNPSADVWAGTHELTGVYRHTGELFDAAEDLVTPERGDSSQTLSELSSLVAHILGLYEDRYSRSAARSEAEAARNLVKHRSYRSQVTYNGPLGHNWDLADNARLAQMGTDIVYDDGTGRADTFRRIDATRFTSPPGIYAVLTQGAGGGFLLRAPRGTVLMFHAFDGSSRSGSLDSTTDRNGNRTTFLYDNQGLLTTVVDPLGRAFTYAYDSMGRIVSLTDFAGRQVVYSYDANGDLVTVRSPIISGTPNGNDFPNGRTTAYQYSSGYADDRLNHNLIAIIRPDEFAAGTAAIQVGYGTVIPSFAFDRVLSETIGGTNGSGVAAGGTLTFSYQSLNPNGDPANLSLARRQVTVMDRNGNRHDYVHNVNGNCLTATDFTNRELRPGEPDYTARFGYDSDGEIIIVARPMGDQVIFTYDKPGADRYREGNLIQVRASADPLSGGGRGDGHGGESGDIVTTIAYEPIDNEIAALTDPRGNDPGYVPQNGGAATQGRYSRAFTYDYQEGDPALNGITAYASRFGISLTGAVFGLGDVNGDGSTIQAAGNVVRISGPNVQLDPASSQAQITGTTLQAIQTTIQWNAHGEPVALADPEQNLHTFAYYPETDPDGDGTATPAPPDGRSLDPATGGFLKTRLIDTIHAPGRDNFRDPGPTGIQYDMKYDPQGTLAALIDGRGVETRFIHNAVNELLEVREAAATADASGPDGTPPTGRGELGLTAFGFLERSAYDADGNMTSVQREDRGATRGVGPFMTTSLTYDILGDAVQSSRPASSAQTLTTHTFYDANQNLVRRTEPDGNSHTRAYDERDLLLSSTRGSDGPLGGTPSTRLYSYDGDGEPSRLTDGRGGIVDSLHDGHDRLTRLVDQVGGTLDLYYDPAGETVRRLSRGTIGGTSPADRSGSGNVDLSDLRSLYDEMERLFRQDRMMFVPAGVVPARPVMMSDGPLLPGDGAVNTIFEYDRLSRPTFLHKDSGATTRTDYDGAGRANLLTDAAGDTEMLTYDASGDPVESLDTEIPSGPGPLQEQFLTTLFYDALGRPTMAVDNLGETARSFYDSLDALTLATDANGPQVGSINRRSPGYTGVTVPINSNGNVTRYAYDAAGRLLTSTRVLTASGRGDGTTSPPPDTTNSANPDGLITLTTSWTGDGFPAQRMDDKGNPTTYAYDNLDQVLHTGRSDGFLQQIGYDGESHVVSQLDPNGTQVTNNYDMAGRLTATQAAPPPGGGGVSGTTLRTYEHDGRGLLTRATDNNQPADSTDDTNIVYLYDSLGRPLEEAQLPPPGSGPPRDSDFGWQAEGLLSSLTYPSGDQVMYAYDGAERLRNMNDMMHPEFNATFDYIGLGRLTRRMSGNGVSLTFLDDTGSLDTGYDGVGRTIRMRHLDPVNTLLAGFDYRYDRVGNPTAARRLHDTDAAQNAHGNVYVFDSANRLVSSQEAYLDSLFNIAGAITDSFAWTLDGPGNWVNLTRNGTLYLNTPNNLNEYDEPQCCGTHTDDGLKDDFMDLASTPTPDGLNLTYDKNGNQTDTSLQGLDYNFANVPVASHNLTTGAAVSAYSYDALGRRTKRQVTGGAGAAGTTTYDYGHALFPFAVEEDDTVGSLIRQFGSGAGGRHLWQYSGNSGSQYLLEDAFGSTIALTPAMPVGGPPNVLERVVYDPYGKPLFESATNVPIKDLSQRFTAQSRFGNPYLFEGMRYDPELSNRTGNINTDIGGLYAAGGYYNPNEGRSMTSGERQPGPTGMPSKLMEEEGIYYFFQHQDGHHRMTGSGSSQGVVVDFLEGDPDRPLVTGNHQMMDAILPRRLIMRVPAGVMPKGGGGRPVRGANGALYMIPHNDAAPYLISEAGAPSPHSPWGMAEYTGWEGAGTLTCVSFDPSAIASWSDAGSRVMMGSDTAGAGGANWDAIVTIESGMNGIIASVNWETAGMKEDVSWDAIVTIDAGRAAASAMYTSPSWETAGIKEDVSWDAIVTIDSGRAAASAMYTSPSWEAAGIKEDVSWDAIVTIEGGWLPAGATLPFGNPMGAEMDVDWGAAGTLNGGWEALGTLTRPGGD